MAAQSKAKSSITSEPGRGWRKLVTWILWTSLPGFDFTGNEMSNENEIPINRGTQENAAFFRSALDELGENQSSFARLMQRYGDDRQPATILRSVQRMAAGEARVSGEMRVLLTFMQRGKKRRLAAQAAKTNAPKDAE